MAKILNSTLSAAAIFFLVYAWALACLKNSKTAFIAAASVAAASGVIIARIQSARNNIRQRKKTKKKLLASFVEFVRFNADNAQLFGEMLGYYRFDVVERDGDIIVATKNGAKCLVAVLFGEDNLSLASARNAVIAAKHRKCDKLYIFTVGCDKILCDKLNAQLPTTVADAANAYALFEQCGKLPDAGKCKRTRQLPMAKRALCRKRFGWYFGSAIFLSATSVIAYFPWYTLCWATVMLALALYSLLNRRYNTPPTCVTLE